MCHDKLLQAQILLQYNAYLDFSGHFSGLVHQIIVTTSTQFSKLQSNIKLAAIISYLAPESSNIFPKVKVAHLTLLFRHFFCRDFLTCHFRLWLRIDLDLTGNWKILLKVSHFTECFLGQVPWNVAFLSHRFCRAVWDGKPLAPDRVSLYLHSSCPNSDRQ